MNPVLKSIEFVIQESKDVKINLHRLKSVCSEISPENIKEWTANIPFDFIRLSDKEEIAFIFIFNSINFCYWGNPKWAIEYQGKKFDGAWAMLASLRRALNEGIPILDSSYLQNITEKELSYILRGNTTIPLFDERLAILREFGTILKNKYSGDSLSIIESSNNDALKLLEIITTDFPSYNDTSIYNGHKVFFHKRAQLAISDISKTKLISFHNIDKLTAFADYKIPQVLRKLNILQYSSSLSNKVDNKILIPQGSTEEIEIRANTIWSVELMKEELSSRIKNITSIDIDSFLWLKGQEKSNDDKPYHLTKTIYY